MVPFINTDYTEEVWYFHQIFPYYGLLTRGAKRFGGKLLQEYQGIKYGWMQCIRNCARK